MRVKAGLSILAPFAQEHDGRVNYFHIDCLASEVRLNVDVER